VDQNTSFFNSVQQTENPFIIMFPAKKTQQQQQQDPKEWFKSLTIDQQNLYQINKGIQELIKVQQGVLLNTGVLINKEVSDKKISQEVWDAILPHQHPMFLPQAAASNASSEKR
jgi:deoxyxylulose-5-phosphate synthase